MGVRPGTLRTGVRSVTLRVQVTSGVMSLLRVRQEHLSTPNVNTVKEKVLFYSGLVLDLGTTIDYCSGTCRGGIYENHY